MGLKSNQPRGGLDAEDDTVRSVEAVNAPPEFMAGKLLIAKRKPVSRERLADMAVSMKDLL